MSMNFDNNIPPFKAQASYKDGGGMGGGGMYFQQKKEEDEDMFERQEEEDDDNVFSEGKIDIKDIPTDNLFNKFINWFKQKSS